MLCPGSDHIYNQYSAYASILQEVVPLDLHGYANDHGVKPTSSQSLIVRQKQLQKQSSAWQMLRPGWTITESAWIMPKEFILSGSKHQLQKCTTRSLSANGEEIPCSNCIKYPGTWMDQELPFRQHILNKCRVSMLNIQCIKLIRNILNEDTTHTLVLGLVMSHLDYCNAIFYGLPEVDLKKAPEGTKCSSETSLEQIS